MKRYCHYHPLSPAKWACKSCQVDFDSTCMPDANEKMQSAFCPKCKKPLTFLDSRSIEQPFWQITPRFFSAPLQPEPLLLILLTMLLSLAIYSHDITRIFAAIITLILVSNYGIHMLRNASKGETKALGISTLFSGISLQLTPGVTILLCSAITSTGLTFHFAGVPSSLFAAALWIWILPAQLMVGVSEDGIKQAFQPKQLIGLMVKMEWAYAGLVSYLLVALITTMIIFDFAQQHLPSIYAPLLTAGTFSYFSIALFSMFGHALMQNPLLTSNRENAPPSPLSNTLTDHIKRLDADIDIALKRGDYADAVILLEGDLNRYGFSDLRRDQLFKLLTALKDSERLEHFAQLFLWLMVGRGKIESAANFVQQLREHNPNFKLFDLELSKVLAENFHKAGEYPLIIWLAKDAHTRFDPDPELAELYLRAAKTLVTKFGQMHKARSYLHYIIDHLSTYPAASAAIILDQHIQRMHITK